MSWAEFARGSAFVALVVAVYVQAVWFLGRMLLVRARENGAAGSTWGRRYVACVLASAALGTACIAYGRFIEPYWLAVRTIRMPIARIPAGAGPVRIAHFSDSHIEEPARLEETLPDAIAAVKPDLIAFTGDAVNGPTGLAGLRRLMERLAKIAPVYVAPGNWDVWIWSELDVYRGLPVTVMSADTRAVTVRGVPLWIAGAGADRPAQIPRLLDARPRDAVSVLLHHFPDEIEVASAHGADVYLAGHTHGGQVAIPGYGALITFSRFGKRFERGLYREGGTWLYVHPGVGMEGGPAPRVRFGVRPEVAVIELVGER